jgi:membrane protease subunit HflK
MAKGDGKLDTDARVQRSVSRIMTGAVSTLVLLAAVGAGLYLGSFTLKPGEAAVILFGGRHVETITQDGLHFRLPPPLVERVTVNYSQLRNEDFGFRGPEQQGTPRKQILESTMQTGGNNIVRLSFAVQYKIKDPFLFEFRLSEPDAVLRDAAQASMREVVGRMGVDDVMRGKKALVASEVEDLLQKTLNRYQAGIRIEQVQLQDVQPPAAVRAAYDDVVAAIQDAGRLVNEAEGYRNELLPKARAQAQEILQAAYAYRETKEAAARGEAGRFTAIAEEWSRAPEVTQRRLYLETMEQVLPDVEKVIIEPGTTQVLPYLPLGQGPSGGRRGGRNGEPPPASGSAEPTPEEGPQP